MLPYRIIETTLKTYQTIAVVGFSGQSNKAGYYVPRYMHRNGYEIIPINPYIETGLGLKAYAQLVDVPQSIEIVQIFRRPEFVVPFVQQAVEIGAKAVWMQQGIMNAEAEQIAIEAGLHFVQDRCMLVEHRHLLENGWDGRFNTPK